MRPVLGRKVVEREQRVMVLGQLLGGLGILRIVVLHEVIAGRVHFLAGRCYPNGVQIVFAWYGHAAISATR